MITARKSKLQRIYELFWRNIRQRQTAYLLLLLALLVFLIYQLSIIPPGAAEKEVVYVQTNSTFTNIINDPLSLPHKIATYLFSEVSSSIRFTRAISIVFFSLSVFALYRILKRWHSDKIALLTSLLFASNATVLAVARLASPEVLLFGWAIVISLLLWLHHGSSRKIAPLMLALAAVALLYIPGAPYFFLLLGILFSNRIIKTFKNMDTKYFYLSIVLGLAVAAPLVYSFVKEPSLMREWMLLPSMITWGEIPGNIFKIPSAFIYKAEPFPLLNVGRLPILDVASGGLFLVGLYAYQRYMKLERTRIMLLTALLGIILGALGQTLFGILLILPFIYCVIAAGISYLLDAWYAVFPKNPFARSFGLLLIVFVVLMSVYYQSTRFLVVWVNAPETNEIYNQSRLIR